MSSVASRQYPRIPLDDPARLSVVRHRGSKCDWEELPVRIRTASCEGVGIAFEAEPPEQLHERDKILLSLRAGNSPIEIPGQVAWSTASGTGGRGGLDVGIRLNLSLANAVARQLYSSWVVAMIIGMRDAADDAGLEMKAYEPEE